MFESLCRCEKGRLKEMQKVASVSLKKVAPASLKKVALKSHNEHGYMCDRCGDRADVRTYGELVCAICYLLDVAPQKVDKLRRKIV